MPYAPIQEPRTLFSYGTRNKDLSQHGVVPTREGAVQGVSAVLLEESLKTDISYVTILVPTQLMSTIDYGGSAAVIDVMNSLFKLGVDATPLRKSDEMRRQMMERGRKGESRGFLSSLRRRPDSGAS
jgi:predicted ATP-grasp superfamily ATP-dependent carboligase